MGLILNPRGTSGSGKTELARRILAEYGLSRDRSENLKGVEPIHRPGRRYPFAYRVRHPGDGRPLVVLGHYQRTSGGCDTIRIRDGGMPEIMRFAADFAARDNDVLIEGQRLSSEVTLSEQLAAAHGLYILLLSTPVEKCAHNLASRQRAARSRLAAIEMAAAEEHQRVKDACARLRLHATVEVLDFDAALARARKLLELDHIRAAA
jgi:hypothetical protein